MLKVVDLGLGILSRDESEFCVMNSEMYVQLWFQILYVQNNQTNLFSL